MGFFNIFNSNTTNSQMPSNNTYNQPVNPTNAVDLRKKVSLRKEIILDEVKRNNITATTARVVFVLDHSGSMMTMYKNGTVQDVLERIFPMAMCFDDNAELEFYWFDTIFKEFETVTSDNLDGYVQKVILSKKDHFGGTCYAPIMNEILNRYGKKEPMNIPTFVIFITDGANSDKPAAKRAITEASRYNIFWKFVGIGNAKFDFLENLDNLTGRFIDNANFVNFSNINNINDTVLYAQLLAEYNDWIALCKSHGIPVGV